MGQMLDELKKYLETTSIEEVLKDWEKTAEWDKIGPSIDEYLKFKLPIQSISEDKTKSLSNIKYETKNYYPEFSSGFLLKL